jgi:hypothetical protein
MAIGRTGVLRAAALLLASLALATPADAAKSRVCRQIEAQLASAEGDGGSSAQARKYERAVTAQRDQLSKARARARSSGCGFSLFGGGKSQCSALNAQIDKMERNLNALRRKHGELAGGGGLSRRDRTRLLASLDANGCRDQEVAGRRLPPVSATRREGSLFDQLFGGGIRTNDDPQREALGRPLSEYGDGIYGPSGNYRTLCVRTCDGYYFPMSGASSGRDFDRDQHNCESMCPGTDIRLYYHDATGQESDQMMSVSTGEPYTALPTAYLYKDINVARPAGCGCNPTKAYEIMAGRSSSSPVESDASAPRIPMPVSRPDPATDPETLANADGGLDAGAITRILAPKPATTASVSTAESGERKVRVVGPAFLPDQEAVIDLRAPAPKEVR